LLEAETDALHAVVHQKGCDFGVTRDGRLAGNKFGPAEAVAEPVRDARDGEGQQVPEGTQRLRGGVDGEGGFG
jgi:hypothetical protein